MLSLIYGTNQVAVRNFILRLAKQIGVSSIKEYSASDPITSIETTLQDDMFGEPTLNVIDITKSSKFSLEKILESIKGYSHAQVLLVDARDLEQSSIVLKAVKAFGGKVISASVARKSDVFKYLDDLYNKRKGACFASLKRLLESDNDPVYILVMLQYQLRNLALAKFGLSGKLSPFQRNAAISQAKNFSADQIMSIYKMLFEFDVRLKTGVVLPEIVTVLCTQKILMG